MLSSFTLDSCKRSPARDWVSGPIRRTSTSLVAMSVRALDDVERADVSNVSRGCSALRGAGAVPSSPPPPTFTPKRSSSAVALARSCVTCWTCLPTSSIKPSQAARSSASLIALLSFRKRCPRASCRLSTSSAPVTCALSTCISCSAADARRCAEAKASRVAASLPGSSVRPPASSSPWSASTSAAASFAMAEATMRRAFCRCS
mmetsp:Transcript_120890/g.341848  ORF Transcript_120890/g.341848 Transcript_120890/m.341848 type:complete len:204 (+) Transcript_120890:1796-2407(+)